MSGQLQTVRLADGIHFHAFWDARFKTNRLSIHLVTPLAKENVTVNALLPQLLKTGYQGCESRAAFRRELEMLYGAYVEGDVGKRGDEQILSLSVVGIDDRFSLDGKSISAELARLLSKLILQPMLEDGVFPAKTVAVEKQALKDTIEAELNEKRHYAINSLLRLMCAEEPSGLPKYGFLHDVDGITPKTLKARYDALLSSCRIELMFTGCGDPAAILPILRESFSGLDRHFAGNTQTKIHQPHPEPLFRQQSLPVNQAKMVLGFALSLPSDDDGVPAMRMMTAMLGGTPSSKLFLNVREKLSLCYYCAARYDPAKAILMIDCGVEKENIERAKTEILAQLSAMAAGDFTEEEQQAALLSLKNSYSSVYETDSAVEGYYLAQLLNGTGYTPERQKELIQAVTREDIVEAAKRARLDAVYLLTNEEEV